MSVKVAVDVENYLTSGRKNAQNNAQLTCFVVLCIENDLERTRFDRKI